MMYLVGIAFRNIRRNGRRSFLAILSVTLSIAFIICLQGMVGGLMGSMVKNYTKNETGHVRITTKKFQEKYRFLPVTETIDNPRSIVQAIRSDSRIGTQVRLITERVNFGVLLSNRGSNKTAMALAGDPVIEKDLLLLNKSILPGGRYLNGERETVVGAGVAKALSLGVGDTIRVVTQGSDHALHMRKFTVVGVFRTGLKMMDDAVFQIGLADAKYLLRMGEKTQQIIIMLNDYHQATNAAAAIRALVPDTGLAVTPWSGIGDYGVFVAMADKIYFWIYVAIALLGAFIIGNIMMMVILERRREIGILKSMGLSRASILALFVSEGMALGLIGSVAGTALGTGIAVVFHFVGIDFTKALSSVSMPMDNVIYFTVSIAGLAQALCIGALVSALVSFLPSWQAARMHPVEAIKSI